MGRWLTPDCFAQVLALVLPLPTKSCRSPDKENPADAGFLYFRFRPNSDMQHNEKRPPKEPLS